MWPEQIPVHCLCLYDRDTVDTFKLWTIINGHYKKKRNHTNIALNCIILINNITALSKFDIILSMIGYFLSIWLYLSDECICLVSLHVNQKTIFFWDYLLIFELSKAQTIQMLVTAASPVSFKSISSGKNGSRHVLTWLVVSQKANNSDFFHIYTDV